MGREFAPLPPGIVQVRLRGASGADFAARLASMPGVRIITGPDAYDGDRLYLTVELDDCTNTTAILEQGN